MTETSPTCSPTATKPTKPTKMGKAFRGKNMRNNPVHVRTLPERHARVQIRGNKSQEIGGGAGECPGEISARTEDGWRRKFWRVVVSGR